MIKILRVSYNFVEFKSLKVVASTKANIPAEETTAAEPEKKTEIRSQKSNSEQELEEG